MRDVLLLTIVFAWALSLTVVTAINSNSNNETTQPTYWRVESTDLELLRSTEYELERNSRRCYDITASPRRGYYYLSNVLC